MLFIGYVVCLFMLRVTIAPLYILNGTVAWHVIDDNTNRLVYALELVTDNRFNVCRGSKRPRHLFKHDFLLQ